MEDEHHFEQAALVVNVSSRRGAAEFRTARDRLIELGVPVTASYPVHDASRLTEAIEHAVADGRDLVIVGGGDGTMSSVVDELAHEPVSLGLLPLGTANDFARTLQVPTNLDDACRTIVDGKLVDVDLGRVGDNHFVNVASIGLSVAVTQSLTPQLKRRMGALAYPLAMFRSYRRHQPFTAWLEFPDADYEHVRIDDLLQVAVGNGRHYGGGYAVSPSASIDDNRLDTYAIVKGRLRDHVNIARLLRDGSFIEHDDVLHLTTQRTVLHAEPAQPINIDGEVVARTPQEFAVDRNALRVLVPQDSIAARYDPLAHAISMHEADT